MSSRPILLVEDDERDVELTLAALREQNLANEVDVVRDGEDALEYLHRRGAHADGTTADPVVVLLDLKLPKVDGLQVLREVKSDRSPKRMPVVVLTWSREERDLVESCELAVNSYIAKPVDFDQFCDAMKQLSLFCAVIDQAPGRANGARA